MGKTTSPDEDSAEADEESPEKKTASGRTARRSASKKRVIYADSDSDEEMEFEDDEEICELECAEGHIFHTECIQDWFYQQKKAKDPTYSCPLCRQEIKNQD